MSYEGYEIILCANGHRFTFDCYDVPPLRVEEGGRHTYTDDNGEEISYDVQTWKCPDCGTYAVWWEGVDQTNDSGWSTKLVVHVPATIEVCGCCGAAKETSPEQYCIPSNQGHRINGNYQPVLVPLKKCDHTYNSCGEYDKPETGDYE